MTDKHRKSAGERAMRKFERNRVMRAKEIKALKAMTPESITAKLGVVKLVERSRTYNKVVKQMAFRQKRLKQLIGKTE